MNAKQLSVENQIANHITRRGRGRIFFSEYFAEFGTSEAVRIALFRLVNKDFLIRLTQGIYLYPKRDGVLGIIYPSLDEIAKAIAKRDKACIVPTGVQALNKLGLSSQIPMKAVCLTDGSARDIQVVKSSIRFKRTTPKNLATKGEISGLTVQSLREIGKNNLISSELERINDLLQKEDRGMLL